MFILTKYQQASKSLYVEQSIFHHSLFTSLPVLKEKKKDLRKEIIFCALPLPLNPLRKNKYNFIEQSLYAVLYSSCNRNKSKIVKVKNSKNLQLTSIGYQIIKYCFTTAFQLINGKTDECLIPMHINDMCSPECKQTRLVV